MYLTPAKRNQRLDFNGSFDQLPGGSLCEPLLLSAESSRQTSSKPYDSLIWHIADLVQGSNGHAEKRSTLFNYQSSLRDFVLIRGLLSQSSKAQAI